jgi:hypothetical protein
MAMQTRTRNLEDTLDRLHARARANPWLYRFAIANRILLAGAFLPTGLVKLLGRPFSSISTEIPIGYFFDAMYRTGGYWRVLGATQILASICLLIPRTAPLGAVIFFPVAVNILAITIALEFGGTNLITVPMLLAALYLLCWDYDRLKGIIWNKPYEGSAPVAQPVGYALTSMEKVACVIGTLGLLTLMSSMRGLIPGMVATQVRILWVSLAVLGVGVVIALASIPSTLRLQRRGSPS